MEKSSNLLKKLVTTRTTHVDNFVFSLHYKWTVAILLIFSIVVTTKQYVGDPIKCVASDDEPLKFLETFCWIHPTFSLEDAWEKKVGEEVPYPGVDQYTAGEERVFHAYYQWVCFVLFFQAVLFYVPHYFWKMWEGGKIGNLVQELKSPTRKSGEATKHKEKPDEPQEPQSSNPKEKLLNEDKGYEKQKASVKHHDLVTDYLVSTFNNNRMYAFAFFVCEFMNLANVVGQIFLINVFLNEEFTTYGYDVVRFTEWDWSDRFDPMMHVFPRMTKCTFHRFGPSGDVQKLDILCILPINNVNEKIYIFLWFWLLALTVLSFLALMYRLMVFLCPPVRFLVLKSRAPIIKTRYLRAMVKHGDIGDFLVLDLLCKNVHGIKFKKLVIEFAEKLEAREQQGRSTDFSLIDGRKNPKKRPVL